MAPGVVKRLGRTSQSTHPHNPFPKEGGRVVRVLSGVIGIEGSGVLVVDEMSLSDVLFQVLRLRRGAAFAQDDISGVRGVAFAQDDISGVSGVAYAQDICHTGTAKLALGAEPPGRERIEGLFCVPGRQAPHGD